MSQTQTKTHDPAPLVLRRQGWLTSLHIFVCCAAFGLAAQRFEIGVTAVFAGAVLATMALIPFAVRAAKRYGIVAQPGGRQLHKRATPLLGGVAIYAVVAPALLFVALDGHQLAYGVLAGGTLVFFLGLIDDIRRVSPLTKIYVQVLAAGCLLLFGFEIPSLQVVPFGAVELSALASGGLIVVWVLVATNALNIIDGLDGLAVGVALLAALALAVLGIWPLAMLAVAGAGLGFSYFNLPRARVFMGDAGSLFLGFVLASTVLLLPPAKLIPIGLAVFAYPIGDVVLTLARRVVRGQPLMRPDRSHIHHKLLEHLASPATVLLLALLFATVEILIAMAYPGLPSLLTLVLGWAGIAVLLVGAGQYTLSTVMATREPVQRVHVITRYVRDCIRLASQPAHVTTALQHLVEGMGLAELSLPGFDIELENRLRRFDRVRRHSVSVSRGQARWSDEVGAYGPRVEIERETTVVSLVRKASERLSYLMTDSHLTTVVNPIPSGVPFEPPADEPHETHRDETDSVSSSGASS